jgi:rRNA-processing protein FCF1
LWDINHRNLRAGVVVDTNLFVLLLVGRYDLSKLERFRATRKYDSKIFHLLERLVSRFSRAFTTAHIVTEVDNLSRQVDKQEWRGISQTLAGMISSLSEVNFRSEELIAQSVHPIIGITDCSVVELAIRDMLIVTDDLPLTIQLERRRLAVINLSRYIATRNR